MRKVININNDWKFIREDEEKAMEARHPDGHWKPVSIPHTWNAVDGANGFDYFKGACWYRKDIFIDSDSRGNKIFAEFNGSNSVTDVYLNGEYLGQHRGGYSTFRFDISRLVLFGENNILAVKVDNTVFDDVYPQVADFTFYGGIYRDVNIVMAGSVHFDLMDYGSKGVYIFQEDVNSEKAVLNIKSRIVNDSENDKKVRLWAEIIDAKGNAVTYAAEEVLLSPWETKEVALPAIIEEPVLWNGRKNPYMYEARLTLTSFNDTVDEVAMPFGVRYFEVDSENGFRLNGEILRLNGVSRHQDRKDMGWAITRKEHEEDMELIKEVGATSIRLAHYQHDQYFYDLCDTEGMVVWAEIPFISVMSKTELEGINPKQQMVELIRQNFNHPSIMFWGVQNEIQIDGERPEVRKLVKELNELTKKEDPTRLTTMANVLFVPDTDEYNYITDVVGYNKYYGWYVGKAEDFAPWLDSFHSTNPHRALCISEYGAEGIIEYHTGDPKVKDYTEEYHALFHETVWKTFEARPFLWATYVWNMFDFGANIRDEGGVKGRNNKGLVTYDRKIRKDAFYMYKAHWSEEKFVHITGKRYLDRDEDSITVKVYSNCGEVTLFVNGLEQETKSADKIFLFGNVRLKEGINEVKAVSNNEGAIIKEAGWFKKVSEPNPSYRAPEAETGGLVSNWFQMPVFDDQDEEEGEFKITDDVYSTRCTFKELLENKEAKAVLFKYLGDFTENPSISMAMGMPVDVVAAMGVEVFTEKLMKKLNRELTKIKK